MFGYVTANFQELTKPQQERYSAVYCGICRDIAKRSSHLARITLQYDMAFLALLLMSLYEPEEDRQTIRCAAHPFKARQIAENALVQYAADLNVALAYYKALDDWQDEKSASAKLLANALRPHYEAIALRFPRQCQAIETGIRELSRLEQAKCANPDLPAAAFGNLMAELLFYKEDIWSEELCRLGFWLGRFIYLMDAVLDAPKDEKTGKYNPLLGSDSSHWEEYLLLAMSRCTECFEKLPLVQDKDLLDNILYSGVWVQYRSKNGKEDHHGTGSLSGAGTTAGCQR